MMYCLYCQNQMNFDGPCTICGNINQRPPQKNEKKAKIFIIGIIISVVVLVVFLGVRNIDFSKKNDSETISADSSKTDEINKLELSVRAIEKIQEINSDFISDPEENFVAYNRNTDMWFAYVFAKGDRGFGYEVFYSEGTYIVHYNQDLHMARRKIIAKLDELRPNNANLNSYVTFNPYGIRYETLTSFSSSGGLLLYNVSLDVFDFETQIELDYYALLYTGIILEELGFNLVGIRVDYSSIETKDFRITSEHFGFTNPDRSRLHEMREELPDSRVASFLLNVESHSMTESEFSNIISSKENFKEFVRTNITYY